VKRPPRRYPVSTHPVAPADLTDDDMTYIESVVEDIRTGEAAGGQCSFVVEVLHRDFGWTGLGGIYHSLDAHPIGDHVWAWHEPTDTFIDPTADQFGEGAAIRFLPAGDPLRERYLHAETEDEEDAWLDAARQRRDTEGEWWWVPGQSTNPHVVAYESEVARWESGIRRA
jgi:hypothetical protein